MAKGFFKRNSSKAVNGVEDAYSFLNAPTKRFLAIVVGVVLLLVLLLVSVRAFAYEPLGTLFTDAEAFPSGDVSVTLQEAASSGSAAESIELVQLKAGDEVYQMGSNLYAGEDRKAISSQIPFFLGDGAGLYDYLGKSTLISSKYDAVESYPDLLLSEGRVFDMSGNMLESDEYYYLKTTNGLFLNSEPLVVSGGLIGSGKTSSSSSSADSSSSSTTNTSSSSSGVTEVANAAEPAGTESNIIEGIDTVVDDAPVTDGGEYTASRASSTTQTTSTSSTGVSQAMAATTSSASSTTSDAATSEMGSTTVVVPANSVILFTEKYMAYYMIKDGKCVYVSLATSAADTTVSYGVGNEKKDEIGYEELLKKLGVLSDSTSTPKASTSPSASPVAASTGSASTESIGWVKPTASSTDLSTSVYTASGTLTINDPAGVITRGVRYEFRQGENLFMRAAFGSSGSFTVTGLQPDATYDVTAIMTYKDASGQTIEEQIFSQTITMGSVSSLETMRFSYTQGKPQSSSILFTDITFLGGSTELLQNASDLAFVIDGKSFTLSSTDRSKLLSGETISYQTSASFTSNSSFYVAMAAADRFGNILPVSAPEMVVTTSKAAPRARLYVSSNGATEVVLGIDVIDPDNVTAGATRLNLYDEYYNLVGSQEVVSGQSLYTFESLGYDRLLHVIAQSTYDLGDGEGLHVDEEIGSMSFTTVSIAILGYAIYSYEIDDMGSDYADLLLSMNVEQMDYRLTALVSDAKITVSNRVTGEVVYYHEVTSNELSRLKAKEPLSISLTGLTSMTDYKVEIYTGAQVGDVQTGVHYDIKTSVTPSTFKTYRKNAVVEFQNNYVTSSIIGFQMRVVDEDRAIGGETYLEIRDPYGRLAADQILVTPGYDYSTEFTDFQFKELEKETEYTVRVYTLNYNQGYNDDTLETRRDLAVVKYTTEDGISAKIELRGLDAISGDTTHLNARLRVYAYDKNSELNPCQFTMKVYRDEKYVTESFHAFTPGQDGDIVDLLDNVVDKGEHTYRFEVYMTLRGKEIYLDEVEFSTEKPIYGIENDTDLRNVKNDLYGSYVFLCDVTSNAYYIGGTSSGIYFQGNINFQGYTLTRDTPYALFYRMGRDGEISNASIIEKQPHDTGVVYDNYGHIKNIKVELQPDPEKTYTTISGIAMYNEASGLIEGFAVDIGGTITMSPISGSLRFAGVTYSDSGTIKDGYVYGGGIYIPDGLPERVNVCLLAGIVDYAWAGSTTTGVISMIDIRVPIDHNSYYVGLLSGYSQGTFTNSLATGNLINYYEANTGGSKLNTQSYGPAVGGPTNTALTKNIFMNPPDQTCNNSYHKAATTLSLYDRQWYTANVVSSAFTVQPVLSECYPQLDWPVCMPEQDDLPLPEKPEVHEPQISSLKVDVQEDETATATISFSNPDKYQIKSILISDLSCQILSQTEDDEGVSRVSVLLYSPVTCKSNYSVLSYTYELYEGYTETVSCTPDRYILPATFYRMVSTPQEWAKIEKSTYENYKLANDLDLSVLSVGDTRLTNSFYGIIDGNGHTVTGIDIGGNGNLISSLYGTVQHITFEDIKNSTSAATYTGAIGIAYGGSTLDDVHVNNTTLKCCYFGGMVASYAQSATVQNCSCYKCKFEVDGTSANPLYIGGAVGYANQTEILSCYAQDITIDASDCYSSQGIGGLVGQTTSGSEVHGGYAVGKIEAKCCYLGGVVGMSASSADSISSVWADVFIKSSSTQVAGLIGRVSGSLANSELNGLAVGDIYISNSASYEVRRAIGTNFNPGRMYAYAGQTIIGGSDSYTPLLTLEELKDEYTYEVTIGLEGFDLTQSANGILPKLLDTDGVLMEGQKDNKLEEDTFYISSVGASLVSDKYEVGVVIKHPEGYYVESLDFDWLDVEEGEKYKPQIYRTETSTSITYLSMLPSRYYDSYCITGIHYRINETGTSQTKETCSKVYFGSPLYRDISSITDWQTVIPDVNRGDEATYENYRLNGDIDFTGYTAQNANINVRVGRLLGVQSGGVNPKIKNINFTFSKGQNKFLFESVTSGIVNIDFENITLTPDDKNTGGTICIIKNLAGRGTAEGIYNGGKNLGFKDITITSKYNVSYVAPIAFVYGNLTTVNMDHVTVTTPTNETRDNRYYYISGLVARFMSAGEVSDIAANKVTVTTGGNYVGIVAGTVESYCLIHDSTVTNSSISGHIYVGGVFGLNNSVSNCYSKALEVTDTTVSGIEYVGGIAGRGMLQNCTFKGTEGSTTAKVLGLKDSGGHYIYGTYVGGITGYGYGSQYLVENATVEGILDVGGVVGVLWSTYYNAEARNCTVNAVQKSDGTYGRNAGGVVGRTGSSSLYGCWAVDCTVTGTKNVGGVAGCQNSEDEKGTGYVRSSGNSGTTVTGNENVGGCYGLGSGYYHEAYACTSASGRQATVTGSTNVGGIVGTVTGGYTLNYLSSDAQVTGSTCVGGIVGYMKSEYSELVNNAAIANSGFYGSVSGTEYVGGMIGRNVAGMNTNTTNDLIVGTVSSSVGNDISLGVGKDDSPDGSVTKMGNIKVYEAAKINSTNARGLSTYTVLHEDVQYYANPTSDQMKVKKFYTNGPTSNPSGMSWSSSYYQIDETKITGGYFPVLRDSSYSYTSSPYILKYMQYTAIPTEVVLSSLPMMTASLSAAMPSVSDLGTVSIYASGVNTINVEFEQGKTGYAFSIAESASSGQRAHEIVSGTVQQRVYTFSYDYSTPLVLTIAGSGGSRSFAIQPETLARTVALWGSEAYYIKDGNVCNLSGIVAEGSYVNLYGGQALSSDGSVTAVASATTSGASTTVASMASTDALASLGTTTPLFASTGWSSFWNFSRVGGTEQGATERDMKFYSLGDSVQAVSGTLPTVADSVLFANNVTAKDGKTKNIRTVLLRSGELLDLADQPTYPSDFKNSGIVYMAHNLDSTSTKALLLYDNGNVLCFDYLTGEVLLNETVQDASFAGFFNFAAEFFGTKLSSLQSLASSTPSYDAYTKALSFENSLSMGAYAGSEKSGTGSTSASGGFATGTSYVSVYEPSVGGYVTYSQDELMNQSTGTIQTLNDRYGQSPAKDSADVATSQQTVSSVDVGKVAGIGGAALTTIFAVIAALLLI